MNSIEYVTTLRESMIQQGKSKAEIVRSVSVACVDWPYVYAAWGEQCTPAGRRRRNRNSSEVWDKHPTIVTACQVLNKTKESCMGCKWNLPVLMYDCRGFTDWCLRQVGIDLYGDGCTQQWNKKSNWTEQGLISDMPRDKVCCLFQKKDNKMEHTGLYLGDGSTCECQKGVQYFEKMKNKWTHYAIPAGLYDDTPTTDKPTIRKGDSGPYVTLAQTQLIQRGYDLGSYGADGKFGNATEKAVKAFQRDWDLSVDGVIGPKTWAMLDSTPTKITYSVTVPHLSLKDAEALTALYPGATITKEGSEA